MRIVVVVVAIVVFGGVVGLLIWARAQPVRRPATAAERTQPAPRAEPGDAPAPPRVREDPTPPAAEEVQPPAAPEAGPATTDEPAAAEGGTEAEPTAPTPPGPAPEPEPVPETGPPPADEAPAPAEPEGPAPPAAAEYMGAAVCATCHGAEDHKWKQLRHAAAWSRLRPEFREPSAKDAVGRACISCHVTGYGQAERKGFVDSSRSAHLLGVQCEACHGPGSLHVQAAERAEGAKPGAITRKPTNCTGCHNPHVRYDEFK